MEVVLFMFRANGATRSFPLTREVTVIGRREDCDLRIPLTEVSRKHCRVVIGAEDVRVEDLGSSNGTFHNGQRVQESVVQPGDYLQVGPVTFAFQIDGTPDEGEIVPPAQPEAGQAASVSAISDDRAETEPRPEQPIAAPGQETMQPGSRGNRPDSPDVDLPPDIPSPPEVSDDLAITDDVAQEEQQADDDIIDLGDNNNR